MKQVFIFKLDIKVTKAFSTHVAPMPTLEPQKTHWFYVNHRVTVLYYCMVKIYYVFDLIWDHPPHTHNINKVLPYLII